MTAANLSFALALGIAGAVLGVTVVWFFAAIPLGIAAVVTGGLALHRPQIARVQALEVKLGLAAPESQPAAPVAPARTVAG